MRVLLLLRGAPGCGKSTWIDENGLKPFTISSDDIRMLYSSPRHDVNGRPYINQKADGVVWKTIFSILEGRMQNGEFTVIDATNSKTSEINRYKNLCDTYKYRMYCVDFTDLPIDTTKKRNAGREPLKIVPEEVIDKCYSRFATQKIPSGVTVIKPDELDRVWMKKNDLSRYKKIHVFGDIHGCYTAYKELLDSIGGYKDDECYIFCGDYLDRGSEVAPMMNELLSIYDKENVFLLEGNHEWHLWVWACGGVARSQEFELRTKTALVNAGVSQKSVRQFYRRLGQCAYFTYYGKDYFVTHGGLSTLPENLTKVSTNEIVLGSGDYKNSEEADAGFVANTTDWCYQIHGHRNVKHLPVKVNDRCFNLEGGVEFGGELRAVTLLQDGTVQIHEVKNDVVAQHREAKSSDAETEQTVASLILKMRSNKFITEKPYGNISSFNFTKDAFYKAEWNDQTVRARGLYVNVPRQKIIARAYEKFFNVNERPETKLEMLQYKLQFPVTAYVKENGFIGLAAYNEEDDSLFITTKSSPEGDYAVWLREDMNRLLGEDKLEKIKQFSKENDVTFVFECVDMERDPHIIEYPESRIYLLDIVRNKVAFEKLPYDELMTVAQTIGLTCKEKAYELGSWQEFFDWYHEVLEEDYRYNGKLVEGFVMEDSVGFMVKLKLAYYNFWKFMRSIAHETVKKGYVDPRRTSSLTTPLANAFYGWIKGFRETHPVEDIPKDICSLRNLFYQSEEGKPYHAA